MTTLATYTTRVRTYLRDWPLPDALTASLSASGATVTVADTSIYSPNTLIQIGQEAILVGSITASTTFTTRQRGARGTTAASFASGTAVLLRPGFLDNEITDALNDGIDACYPLIYQQVYDTSLTGDGTSYEFTVPSLSATVTYIPRIIGIDIKTSGDTAYRQTTRWEMRRGATPKIKFFEPPFSGDVIRVRGFGPFAHLSAQTDTLDARWPLQAEFLPVLYAAGTLLASGEAGRVRLTAGAVDSREQANRTGSSSAAGRDLLQRFRLRLQDAAMAPLPPHIVSVT